MSKKRAGKKRVTLACAVIENGRGQVLIARRRVEPGAPGWEFPGEAVRRGESPEAAARRAALEKAGLTIEVSIGQPPFQHELADRVVTYRYFFADVIAGQVRPLGYEELRWIEKPQLREYEFDTPTQSVVDWMLDD